MLLNPCSSFCFQSESLSFDEIITSQNGNIPLMNIFSRLQSFIQRRIPSVATYQPNSSSPSDLILNSYHLPVFRRPVREVLSELEDSVKRLLVSFHLKTCLYGLKQLYWYFNKTYGNGQNIM